MHGRPQLREPPDPGRPVAAGALPGADVREVAFVPLPIVRPLVAPQLTADRGRRTPEPIPIPGHRLRSGRTGGNAALRWRYAVVMIAPSLL